MNLTITIVNWEDHNPRKDLKRVPWVRLESSLPTSRKVFGLTPEQKWFWVFLLATAGEQNKGGVISGECEYFAHLSGLTSDGVIEALRLIELRALIRVDRIPYGVVRDQNGFVPNGTERNGTERNSVPPNSEDQKPKPDLCSEFDHRTAAAWADHARSVSKTVKVKPQEWADTVRQLRELDKFSEPEIEAALNVVRSDPFWREHGCSLPAMRSRSKNGKKKIENVLAKARLELQPVTRPAAPRQPQRPKVVMDLEQLKREVDGDE